METFKERLEKRREFETAWSLMQENKDIGLIDTIYRPGSPSYFEFIRYMKDSFSLYEDVNGSLDEAEIEFLQTDIGEFDLYEGRSVPLDFPFISEEKDNDDVELNKPKRGGPKKFYVYVRDPKTKNVKKVTFGDTSGLTIKYNNEGARKSFVARHKCAEKNDKTKPGYWSCRVPKYWKALGLEKPESDFRFW